MPFLSLDWGRCYYRLEGDNGRPVVMLSHSLGLDHGMWDRQTADLLPHVQVLRYDLRGHGASDGPAGDYRIDELGRDALALADGLGIPRFAFCGLSIGGMVGQWLAAHAPDRLSHVVLANTSPRVADPQAMEERRRKVLDSGMSAVADVAMRRFFSPGFLQSSTSATARSRGAPTVAWVRRTLLQANPVGYAGCCAAVRDMDQIALLPRIEVPALVIGGDLDESMPWEGHGGLLARSIRGAHVVRLPAAHLSNLERPRSFSAALLDFLVPRSEPTLESGSTVRRAVLGDAHVDAAATGATELTREFQDLITRFAWGAVWTRPGLDQHTRRLLVLAATAALGRWEEFRLHVRTGLAHELEPCDIKEVLLQVGVYAGLPAANTAFQIAAEEQAASQKTV